MTQASDNADSQNTDGTPDLSGWCLICGGYGWWALHVHLTEAGEVTYE